VSDGAVARHRAIAALRAFAGGRGAAASATTTTAQIGLPPRAAVERCELCGASLTPGHDHLVDPASRELHCACTACALLFHSGGETRRRRVRRRVEHLADFRMSDAQWSALHIPIAMAFFFRTSARPVEGSSESVIALFPSPAGATEAWLEPAAWAALSVDNPVLAELEPDVEALLVLRLGAARDHFRVSIDVGYALVGLLRSGWRGLSGGPALWAEIEGFFAALKAESATHA
jgi:hypothetical protein